MPPVAEIAPPAAAVDVTGGIILLLSLTVVVFALLSRRVQAPYPIVLVLAGMALSAVPALPQVHLEPGIVFYVFLPPLLYAAAWVTPWREFSHNIVSILSMACGLVGFTVIGVALTAGWMFPGFDWRTGLILGAVVAPTDAVAASAIASRVGLPHRIVDLLEGESLINDATGLLALEFGIAWLFANHPPTIATGAARFGYLVVGGIGAGAVVATAVAWIEERIEDGPIEITISLLVPYLAYLAADALHASGVLAVVVAGLMLSRRSARFFSPVVRLQIYAVWTAIVFILNGLVFVLIGLQVSTVVRGLQHVSTARLALDAATFSALVIVLRMLWVVPGAKVSYFIRRRFLKQIDTPPTPRELIVVAWGGMRGVVSLAAAIALPVTLTDGAPFEQRGRIVFLAFSIVLSTLVVQGLTLSPLIRLLGVSRGTGPDAEEQEARRSALHAALDHLDARRRKDSADFGGVYDELAQHLRHQLDDVERPSGDGDAGSSPEHDRRAALSQELLRVQRRTLLRLRHNGRINDQLLRKLERELDLQDARHHHVEVR